GVVLQRDHPAAQVAHARAEPEGRVAARAADLEDVAARMVRHEPEQEPPGRGPDRPRPHGARQPLLALQRVLLLEPAHDGQDALVEHYGISSRTWPSTTCTT